MSYQDKSLQCSDCGATFTFSAQDQEFFASKGYTNEPKRCNSCRDARKAERAASGGGGFGGGRSYSGGSSYAPRQMFPATCSLLPVGRFTLSGEKRSEFNQPANRKQGTGN